MFPLRNRKVFYPHDNSEPTKGDFPMIICNFSMFCGLLKAKRIKKTNYLISSNYEGNQEFYALRQPTTHCIIFLLKISAFS
jgi:hypothetical protein